MRKKNNHIIHLGQKLLTLSGQAPDANGKMKNVWESHGNFPTRQAAYSYAAERRPGKKAHVEGQRFDSTPVPGYTRREE